MSSRNNRVVRMDTALGGEVELAARAALGGSNYHSPRLTERLLGEGVRLLAPYKAKKKEKGPWPRFLVQKRRRAETVIGQVVERYNARRVWARDCWHLCSRWLHKVQPHACRPLLSAGGPLAATLFSAHH